MGCECLANYGSFNFLRYATREDMVEKYGFASYTMIQNNIAEATHSFMKDNIQPWILKQIIESIHWCSDS